MFYRCFFILIMCLLSGISAWGADSYTYKTLSIDEGLSQSNVHAMLRDSRGYLWIGTKFGLNLYDNNRITNYYHSDDSNSIPDNEIRLIWEDDKERVWVAGTKGVSVFDRVNNEFSPVTRPDGRPLNIRSVYQAPGQMVMGGAGVLFSYDEAADTIQEIAVDGAPNVYFTGIYPRSDTNWLLSTRWSGLYSYNPQTHKAEKADFTDAQEVTAVEVDSQGYIWVSEYGEGVKCYDHFGHLRGAVSLRKLGYETDIVLDIHDHGDEVWLATDGAGIIVIDKSSMTLHRLCKDLFAGHSLAVNALYEDAFGNTYAGTVRDGAMMIFPTAMRTYSTLLSEQSDLIVTSIAPCGDKVFFGSDGAGVLTFDADNDGFSTILATRGMKVTSISPVDDTTLLVATYEKGFFLLDVVSGRISPAPKILAEIVAANFKKGLSYKLWTVDDGKLVVVTDRVYLCDLKNNKYSAVAVNGDLRQDEAMKPFGHMGDIFWLFTAKGVYKMSLSKLSIDKFYELPIDADIKCADFDERGNIYVATEKALFRIDAETGAGHQIHEAPGRINTIVVDGDDMWLGADNTLYRRSVSSGRLTKFNQYDGVRPNEFLGRPVLVDSDFIMIGGINGLLKINKRQLNEFDNRPQQAVNITLAEIQVDGESMYRSLKNGIIDISDNHTTIELRIIDSEPTPMRNKTFRYYIASDSKEWMLESDNRYLQLSMLPHGSTYHISVSCSTPDGEWTDPAEIVAIKVKSPWWLSWWAFILYLAVVLAIVAVIVNHRKNMLIKENSAKQRHMLEKEIGFMVNINHELRTPLSLIYGPLLKLTKQLRERNADKEVIDEMSKIASQAEKMRGVINMSMEAWRTRAVTSPENIKRQPLNEWVKELVSEFDNAAEVKNQTFEVSLVPETVNATYDRGRLTVVMNNIITFAMKYSPKGATIQVATFTEGTKIGIRVSKQANGVTQADIPALFSQYSAEDSGHFGSGLGLAYAKVIVEMYGGSIRAFLNDDASILTVEVALAQSYTFVQDVSSADASDTNIGVAASTKNTMTIDKFNASALTAFVIVKDSEIGNYIVSGLKPRFKSVVYIPDSHQALMQIRNVLPDIVITSYDELCSQIKDASDLKHIPVVLLTSGDSEKDKDTAYRVGADRYVSMPFEMETLMSRCSNLLYTRSILKERYKSEASPVLAENASNNADETFLMRVNEIIIKNLQNPEFSVNTIVDKMLMSRSALYTRFKDLSGQSLGNYIQDIRLAKAKDMLADVSLPISEISDLLGFSSQRYFSTFFKGKTGITPSQWRANLAPQE